MELGGGPAISEAELARRAAEGDSGALREIVGLVADRLLKVAWQICRDGSVAEDLSQEGLIKITDPRVLSAYRGKGSLQGYLMSCGTRAMISSMRRAGYSAWPSIDTLDADHSQVIRDSTDVEGEAFRGQLSTTLRNALLELPEQARLVVLLLTIGDLTYAEVAETLGMSLGTVKSTYFRARSRLQASIESSSETETGAGAHG